MNNAHRVEPLSSKEKIILAAERLFAEHGIQAVSLRQIATVAEQGNTNAVRYHFGSKESLVQAIFEYRVTQMEAPRAKLLAQAAEKSALHDARTLFEMIFKPHLDLVDAEGKHRYSTFLCHYLLYLRPKGVMHLSDLTASDISPCLSRIMALLRQRLSYLPDDVADRRIRNGTLAFLSTLMIEDGRKPQASAEEFEQIIDDTIEQVVQGTCAPYRL